MVDIASELQWKYVNTIAEAGTYGEKGIEAFKEAAKKSGELIELGLDGRSWPLRFVVNMLDCLSRWRPRTRC